MIDSNEFISELFRIISGALRLDVVKVRNYSQYLADKLEASGETATAARLRKLLAETDRQLKPVDIHSVPTVPVDGESRFALVERIDARELDEETLILKQEQQDLASEFITVAKCQSQLEAHGLALFPSLLLYGPPGCGKTRLARHVAKELGLPLYMARLDGLISSFLGSTAKNIRAIFEFASRNPGVLLLDEFDAIAKLRDDKQELGELKRVVNSFLQNLDSVGTQTILIAATNHHQLLDPAVWRRFSYTIKMDHPDMDQRINLWKEFLKPISWPPKELRILADLSEGLTGADIREISLRLRRRMIVHKTEPHLSDAFTGLRQLVSQCKSGTRVIDDIACSASPDIVRKLRGRNSKLYSRSHLGALLGISRATIYRWEKGDNHG